MSYQELAKIDEGRFLSLCCTWGISAVSAGPRSPYDFLVGNDRVEFKTCYPQKNERGKMVWKANVQRHGSVDESTCDFYVVKLNEVPECKAAVYMLLKAPVETPTLSFTVRSMMNGDFQYAVDFKNWIRSKSTRQPREQKGE